MSQHTMIQSARILVIDDEPANVQVLLRTLTSGGFTHLESVTDPALALDRIRHFDPDLVLLDLHMPPPDGHTLLALLNELEGEARRPVMVLTADVAEETRERALKAGANDFLTKPFRYTETLLRVRNLLHARFVQQDLARANRGLEAELEFRSRADYVQSGRRREDATDIDRITQEGLFRLDLHPIMALRSDTILGAEARAHITATPERTTEEWVGVARALQMESQLEITLIEAALRRHLALPNPMFICVRASPSTVRSEALVDLIASHPRADSVVIELDGVEDHQDTRPLGDALARLRALGARLLVNDTASTSVGIGQLLRFHPDMWEVDGALLSDLLSDPTQAARGQAVATFARDTGTSLVARGLWSALDIENLRLLAPDAGPPVSYLAPAGTFATDWDRLPIRMGRRKPRGTPLPLVLVDD